MRLFHLDIVTQITIVPPKKLVILLLINVKEHLDLPLVMTMISVMPTQNSAIQCHLYVRVFHLDIVIPILIVLQVKPAILLHTNVKELMLLHQ